MSLLQIIIIASLWCNGLFIITGEGMILEKLDKLAKKMPPQIAKPLILCIVCMGSIHGILWSFILLPFSFSLLWQIPLICVSVSGLNLLLNTITVQEN